MVKNKKLFPLLKFHLNIFLLTNPLAWLLSQAYFRRGWGSSVGIETLYGLQCSGIEFHCGARFFAFMQIVSGAHSASYTMDTGCLLGVNRSKRGVDHPPPSSAEFKERVELYF